MNLLNDLRYALRQLRKSPGFTCVAVLTLALCIGAATTIFTLVYNTLLRPLSYPHPGRMVVIHEQVAEWRDLYPELPVNANHLLLWQRRSNSFASIAAMRPESLPLSNQEKPARISVLETTASFFPVFQVEPKLGRPFLTREDQPGEKRVVILMDGLWQSQFHSDPTILGKTIQMDGWPYQVVGVMPASFHLPMVTSMGGGIDETPAGNSQPIQAIVPLSFTPDQLQSVMGDFNYFVVGRLKSNVSLSRAADEIDALEHAIAARLAADDKATFSAVLTPFQEELTGHDRKPLTILLIAVGGILLIGCINIMNLLLARFTGRRKEMALRAAFGGSRLRITRTAIMEALVLACVGGVIGIAAAALAVPILQRYVPAELNFSGRMHVDLPSATFGLALILLTAVFSGLIPAWLASGADPQEALRSESQTLSASREGNRMRKSLVSAEVALAVALVTITGLLTGSMVHLLHVRRGFDATNTITAKILLPDKGYGDQEIRTNFYRDLAEKMQAMPGTKSAAITSILPLDGNAWGDMIARIGDTRSLAQLPTGYYRWVSSDYFKALQMPLVSGRLPSSRDFGHPYAIITQKTAKSVWPGQDPVGRQFRRGDPSEPPFTVIGVVANGQVVSLNEPDPMLVYVPYWYRNDDSAAIVVRTAQTPTAMANTLRKTIWSIDPQIAVHSVRSMGGIVDASLVQRRFEMDLLALFALSALLLATLGVYGVVMYSVVQRMHEMGIRIALGAQESDIYRVVLWEGLSPVLLGAAIGVCIAFAAGNVIASLLFGISPYDPLVAIAAICVLTVAGTFACLLPARRAALIDPMRALRNE